MKTALLIAGVIALMVGAALPILDRTAFANPDDPNSYFVRGDTNNDGNKDISDAVFLLSFLFLGGDSPPCIEVTDINDDGAGDISDAVYMLRFLFLGEAQPLAPFPVCGHDPNGAGCRKSMCNY